jgi:hypothetical protein
VVRRLLKQAILHQVEWNYGNQERVTSILRKHWSPWWRKNIDGVSPLEYSLEFVQQHPLEALKGIPLALARAAQNYLVWYERYARKFPSNRSNGSSTIGRVIKLTAMS